MAEVSEAEWKEWRMSEATKSYLKRLDSEANAKYAEMASSVKAGNTHHAAVVVGTAVGLELAIRIAEVES